MSRFAPSLLCVLRLATSAVAGSVLVLVLAAGAWAGTWNVTVHETTENLSARMASEPAVTFGQTPATCEARELSARVGSATASGTAFGQEIVLVNGGTSACSLRGYPALSFTVDGVSSTAPVATGDPYGYVDLGPAITVLAPGATASFAFGGAVSDEGVACPSSSALRIVAPGDTRAVELPLTVPVCASGLVTTAIGFGSDSAAPGSSRPAVQVRDDVRYQAVTGVGAAMTDTSAYVIHDVLAPSTAAELMGLLYTAGGVHLAYTLAPIGASDFTRTGTPYTLDDLPAGATDPGLTHFSVAHDVPYILPTLRQMRALDPAERLIAVPWTAPPWMKANDAYGDGNHRGALLGADVRPFADYIARFVRAYDAAGVRVDAVSPENEPSSGAQFPGMELPAATEAAFIPDDLAPALASAGVDPEIYGSDSAWSLDSYAETLIDSPARSALTGIASHCYTGTPDAMTTLHDLAPSLDEIVTECSTGISPLPPSEVIIASMRNWASAVMVWNIALDSSGGPVQPPNTGCVGCSGLVTVDPATGTFTPTRTYWQLAQFGHFVEPGAVRIGSTSATTYSASRFPGSGDEASPGLDDVAFRNPDGSRVLLAYDNSKVPVQFSVSWHGRSFVDTLPAQATATFTWDEPATLGRRH